MLEKSKASVDGEEQSGVVCKMLQQNSNVGGKLDQAKPDYEELKAIILKITLLEDALKKLVNCAGECYS